MTRLVLAILTTLTLLSAGCEPPVNEDGDGDGYLSDVDCDDEDPAIHPDVAEICDGIDNNCNEQIDEGATTTFYTDADLDGFGDPDLPVEACEITEGLSENLDDCNDDNPDSYPDAIEVCDGEDNDCNKLVDEDVTQTFYTDADGDGSGDAERPVEACELRPGIVRDDTDCNDLDAEVSPGADEVCDGVDNNCSDEVDEPEAIDALQWWRDADKDTYGNTIDSVRACNQPFGYVDNDQDCNDDTNLAYPGAPEYCDDLDNNCDSVVDEDSAVDAPTWFSDSDEDGFGVETTVMVACYDPGPFWVSEKGDCDDAEPTTYPGAPEYCDGEDDDCDTIVDENDAVDAATWYRDGDKDTFGDPATTTKACSLPTGFVADDTDCDDTDIDVNPDADEVCDTIDNDCDTIVDEDDALDADTWYLDADKDTFGDPAVSKKACSKPTAYVADKTDCDDSEKTTYPGADEYCDTVDNDCDTVIDEDDALDVKTWYADKDGDTYGDPAVTTVTCYVPTGYVGNSRDCDDTDGELNPTTPWYYDADLDGYGAGSASYTQCLDPGTYYVRTDDDCQPYDSKSYPGAVELCLSGTAADGVDNDCDTVVDEECPDVHCGTIAADETWSKNTYGHLVTCNTYVQGTSAPLLSIAAGAKVEFLNNTGLYIGYSNDGDIDIAGTTSSAVEFTSNKSTPRNGDYYGLILGSKATGSYISGLDIRYAGGSSSFPGAIYLTGNDTPIENAYVSNSARHGIFISSGYVEITGTTIENNDQYGVYCNTEACLDTKDGGFAGNTVTKNDQLAMRVWPSNVHYLGTSSSYSGNVDDQIQVTGGTVARDSTWHDLGVPYQTSGNIYVQDNTYAPVLSLDDGVVIEFSSSTGMYVGWSYSGDLDINGSVDGVVMTSSRSVPAPGDWTGLLIGTQAGGSTDITGLDIGHAGSSTSYPGNLYVAAGSAIKITDSKVHDSTQHGIHVYNSGVHITNTDIVDNDEFGLSLATNARLSGTLSGSELSGNDWPAILPAQSAGMLAASTTFSGNTNDYVQLNEGTITSSTTWADIDVPYYSTVNLYVQKASTGATLTLADGVDLRMGGAKGIFIGQSYPGDLVISGDRDLGKGVTIDSYSGSGPGSWYGIVLWSNTSSKTVLEGFELTGAGGSSSYQGGIYLNLARATINDCVIADNKKWGIYMVSSTSSNRSDLDLSNCTISGTETTNSSTLPDGDGLHLTDNEHHSLTLSNVTLTANDRYPLALHANQMTSVESEADGSDYTSNGTDKILVHGGTVRGIGSWADPGVPYLVADTISIYNTSTTPANISTSNTEFEFGAKKGVHVGYSGEGDFIADNVVFTSGLTSPVAGDWCGVYFASKSTSRSEITNSTVEYGGATTGCLYGTTYSGNIVSVYGEPTIDGNAIYQSGTHGVDLWYSGGAAVTDNSITSNTNYGVRCTSSSGATVSGNTFSGNGSGNTSGC
jgi:parallel beta-helix repeat protein